MRFVAFGLVFAVLVSCTDRSYTPVTPEALEIGDPVTVFTATTRQQKSNGSFGFERSDGLQLIEQTVTVPPNHTPGYVDFAYAQPDPSKEFTLAEQVEFPTTDAFLARMKNHAKGPDDEVVVFVHGYNSTQAEASFRAAQLAYDIRMPGALMVYSWPSQGKVLGYAYDSESMLFARDGLEDILRKMRGAGIRDIVLVGHSMGTALVMETLRQIEISDPGWSKRSLNGVVLISPDLDVDLFRAQMERIEHVPEPFVLMVSGKDRILGISALLRGDRDRERLGNLTDADEIEDLPVQILDTTEFAGEAASGHFVAGTSPALITLFNEAQRTINAYGTENALRERLLPGATIIREDSLTEIRISPDASGFNDR
jgi:esterase/lipase superfamily enzyme